MHSSRHFCQFVSTLSYTDILYNCIQHISSLSCLFFLNLLILDVKGLFFLFSDLFIHPGILQLVGLVVIDGFWCFDSGLAPTMQVRVMILAFDCICMHKSNYSEPDGVCRFHTCVFSACGLQRRAQVTYYRVIIPAKWLILHRNRMNKYNIIDAVLNKGASEEKKHLCMLSSSKLS